MKDALAGHRHRGGQARRTRTSTRRCQDFSQRLYAGGPGQPAGGGRRAGDAGAAGASAVRRRGRRRRDRRRARERAVGVSRGVRRRRRRRRADGVDAEAVADRGRRRVRPARQLESERDELVDTLRAGAGRLRELPQARAARADRARRARHRAARRGAPPGARLFDGALGSVSLDDAEMEKVRDGVERHLRAARRRCSRRRASSASRPTAAVRPERARGRACRTTATASPDVAETMRTGLPPEGPGPAAGDGQGDARRVTSRWLPSGSGSRRTTTRSSACRRARPRRRSRAPTGSWRSSSTPTPTPGDKDAEERFKEISAAQRRARRRREAQGVRPGPRDGRVRRGPGWFGPGGFGPGGAVPRWAGLPEHPVRGPRRPRRISATSSATFRRRSRAAARRGGAGPVGPQRGHDLETELHLDFLDAVHGITTSVNITSEAPCPVCDGTGAKPGTLPSVHHVWRVGCGRRRPGTVLVLAGVPHLRRSRRRRQGQVQALQGPRHRGAPARR